MEPKSRLHRSTCLVPLMNRPTAHQRRRTKRLRMLCSPVTDILVSSRTASLLHATAPRGGAGFIVMTGRRWVHVAPRAQNNFLARFHSSVSRRRCVFFCRACVFMCTRRRSLFTDCCPPELLFLVFIHKVKVDRRELHYCTEVIERRAIC